MNHFSNYAILHFNKNNKTHFNLLKSQHLFNDFTLPSNLCSLLKHKLLLLLVVLAKKCVYSKNNRKDTQPVRIPRKTKFAMENREM